MAGLSRRDVCGAVAALAAGLVGAPPRQAFAQSAKQRTRVILLGTAGGPLPKPSRYQTSQVVIIDDHPYLIDCGDGVGYRLVQAGARSRPKPM